MKTEEKEKRKKICWLFYLYVLLFKIYFKPTSIFIYNFKDQELNVFDFLLKDSAVSLPPNEKTKNNL